jgi:hypothetical protein
MNSAFALGGRFSSGQFEICCPYRTLIRVLADFIFMVH